MISLTGNIRIQQQVQHNTQTLLNDRQHFINLTNAVYKFTFGFECPHNILYYPEIILKIQDCEQKTIKINIHGYRKQPKQYLLEILTDIQKQCDSQLQFDITQTIKVQEQTGMVILFVDKQCTLSTNDNKLSRVIGCDIGQKYETKFINDKHQLKFPKKMNLLLYDNIYVQINGVLQYKDQTVISGGQCKDIICQKQFKNTPGQYVSLQSQWLNIRQNSLDTISIQIFDQNNKLINLEDQPIQLTIQAQPKHKL